MRRLACLSLFLLFAGFANAETFVRDALTRAMANTLYVNASGDTMTGALVVPDLTVTGTCTGCGSASTATFLTQTPDAGLANEQALSLLSTGIMKVTTTTGVVSTAVAGDFPTLNQNTSGTAAALGANPTNCSAGNYPLGIAANGDVESCTAAGGGGTPGGSDTQVQFNDSSAFGGDSQLTFNKSTGLLTLTGASLDGSTLFTTAPSSGTSYVRATNNGQLAINADASGANPLDVKYNGGSSLFNVHFDAVVSLASSGVFSFGGFNILKNSGASNDLAVQSFNSILLQPGGYAGGGAGTRSVTVSPASAADVSLRVQNVASQTADSFQILSINGASRGIAEKSELLTLSTGGTTTVTAANLVPANSVIESIAYRITTTITTATAFTVKVTGGNVFNTIGTATSSQTTMTANATGVLVPSAFADQYNSAATTITVDTTGTPGAGVIRLTVFSKRIVPPAS